MYNTYMMYSFHLFHNFDLGARGKIEYFLLPRGFEEDGIRFIGRLQRETKERFHPDQLIVSIRPEWFRVEADYACYRGKQSWLARQ